MESKRRHRLSTDMRELQARLVRALNGGFIAPSGQRNPAYRLRDGKSIRTKSAIRLDRQLAQWENSHGIVAGNVPVEQSKVEAVSDGMMKVLRVGMLWITLTPEERELVITFGKMHDESQVIHAKVFES